MSETETLMKSSKYLFEKCDISTKAIHVGQEIEKCEARPVVPPIYLSNAFKQFSPGKYIYKYGRSGNPTRENLEQCLASMENSKYALCFSSGIAAITSVCSILEPKSHVLICDDVYGETNKFFRDYCSKMGIELTFINMLNLEETERSLRPNTSIVWIETPTNPLLKIIDIQAVSELVKKHSKNALVVVDNTFCTPYFQLPLTLGANLSVYSLSQYINGHSDVIMGAVVLNDEKLYDKLKNFQNLFGAIPSPFDCYLVYRGVKTLAVRMKQHMENGIRIAKWLENHPKVERVIYPPLDSHKQHTLFTKQMKGFGGIISIYLKGNATETNKFLNSLNIFVLAESLGSYESLIEHPATMTHVAVPKEQRDKLGITENFVRLSIGLEAVDDLVVDLEQALEKIK